MSKATFQTSAYERVAGKRPYGSADWRFIPVTVAPEYRGWGIRSNSPARFWQDLADAIAARTPLAASATGYIGYTQAKKAIQAQYPAVTLWIVCSREVTV